LRELLDGSLPEIEQAELNAHLESCESCQQTLESLVAGKESWFGAARNLAQSGAARDAALKHVIGRAKHSSDEVETTGESASSGPPNLDFLKPSDQPGMLGRLGHYDVIEVVGRGGFGVVLKAFDTSLRRVVAIKVLAGHLATSVTGRRRFVREARAAAAVIHDHVVAIHSVEDSHEPPYFVMQFIEGKTLQERIDAAGPLTTQEILRIGMQTAAGLAAAHAQGLVHRDIKPANILLENGVERVKITDFGLARAADDASVTQSGVVAGTPQFMSPEQAAGESVDARADLFSLGSVMYAMCTGRPPFRATTAVAVLRRVCDETPRPIREINPDIADWLEAIIAKLHAKNPADRLQSATEVRDLLGQHLAHLQQPVVMAQPAGIGRAPLAADASPKSESSPPHGLLATLSLARDDWWAERRHRSAAVERRPHPPSLGRIAEVEGGRTQSSLDAARRELGPTSDRIAGVKPAPIEKPDFYLKLVTLPPLGLFIILLVVFIFRMMRWQEMVIATLVLGLWVAFIRCVFGQRYARALEAAGTSPPLPRATAPAYRVTWGLVSLGLFAIAALVYWLCIRTDNVSPRAGHSSDETASISPTETAIGNLPAGPAWGPPRLPSGMQLGLELEPRKEVYRAGKVVVARLTLRNSGTNEVVTTLPRLEVLEKFGFDRSLLDERDNKMPWRWGMGHKGRELWTVSGGLALHLKPDAAHELPTAELVIGNDIFSETAMAHLEVVPGQTCHLVAKLGTYGYAKGEGEPLESGIVRFRVAPADEEQSSAPSPTSEELDRLVELAERELERMKKLVESKAAPPAAVNEAEIKVLDAHLRRARARQDQAGVVSLLRRLVEIREIERNRIETVVKAAVAPPSELEESEKRLIEATLQLKAAEQ
jgi:serine/threonine-protein kinase